MRKIALLAAVGLATFVVPYSDAKASHWDYYYNTSGVTGETEIVMAAGSTRDVTLRASNRGYYRWRGGSGWRYVSLYTTEPYARSSPFYHPSWRSRIQPAALWEYRVESGETGSFRFTLQAPDEPGTYTEHFHMAVEDTAWIEGGELTLTIRVVPKGSQEAAALGPGVGAEAWAVMDATTGKVIDGKNADEVRSIASLTKLMTAMVSLQDIQVNRSRAVTLASIDEVGGARLRVSVGSTWSVGDILASTLIGSTNNTAHALARSTGLPMDDFIGRMNLRANAMGLYDTTFADPTGIEVANMSTANDVARMALNAFNDPVIRYLTSLPSTRIHTVDGSGYRTISNTNLLVNDAEVEVIAGKTGFLYESGWTLATQLRKPGEKDLIIVVLGCADRNMSMRDAKNLAEWAWDKI